MDDKNTNERPQNVASSYDFFIAGQHDAGKAIVANALAQCGFAISATPKGGIYAERGDKALTLWFGAAAARRFYLKFVVEYFTDAHGNLVARFNRELGRSILMGSYLGADIAITEFGQTANHIFQQLMATGVFVAWTENP